MDQDPLRKERVEEHLLEELGELESAVAQKRASEQPQLAPSAESEEVLEAEVVAENSSESTYRNNLRKLLCNIDHTSALLDEVKSLYDILIGNLDAYSVEDDAGLDRVQAALTQAKASKEALFTLTPLLPREA